MLKLIQNEFIKIFGQLVVQPHRSGLRTWYSNGNGSDNCRNIFAASGKLCDF